MAIWWTGACGASSWRRLASETCLTRRAQAGSRGSASSARRQASPPRIPGVALPPVDTDSGPCPRLEPRLTAVAWCSEPQGLAVYLGSQCLNGALHPELYRSGSVAIGMGVESGPQMTPECAVVKMMLCLEYPDVPMGVPIAGEL